MASYYLVKKDGNQYRFENKAAVYDMFVFLGRKDVVIEHHIFDIDQYGNEVEYILIADKVTKRTSKSGSCIYHLHFVAERKNIMRGERTA